MSNRANNPAGLGIIPLLVAGAAALTAGAGGLWWWSKESDKAEMDLLRLPGPKAAPAPSAPQTRKDFATWSPTLQLERDRIAYNEWEKTAMDPGYDFFNKPKGPPPPSEESSGGLYIALFVAAAALVISFKD